MRASPIVFLIDNGSLRAEATLALRNLAKVLSARIGVDVEPVSLLHSNKIPTSELEGKKAQTVRSTLRRFIETGERTFIFLPLFLGPSLAITDYLPKLIAEARQLAPDVEVTVATTLAGNDVNSPDLRLAEMLVAHVRQLLENTAASHSRIAVIDHGTPVQPVNQLRNAVTGQVAQLMKHEVDAVVACSMERRQGPEYAFNEPLLENLDQMESWRGSDLVVAMFFLLPGRHAGEGGDVAQICDDLIKRAAFRSIRKTALLGEHPLLTDILTDRFKAALSPTMRLT